MQKLIKIIFKTILKKVTLCFTFNNQQNEF